MAFLERKIQDTTVAVIGGAGFLGSHLVDYLINERNCEVLVLDNLVVGQKKYINPLAKFVWCDVTHSEENLVNLLRGYNFVFNYAAEPYIPDSFARPIHTAEITAMAALRVMNAAQIAGAEAILQVSSAEIYGKLDGKKDENTLIEPHSTYGVSKVFADGMVQVRYMEAETPVIALRQFNCYGKRPTHPYVIPEIIKQIIPQLSEVVKFNKDVFVKLGNNSSRDFQYAEDAVRMAVELLEKGEFGEVYNMGSEDTIKIYDLARQIGNLMNVNVVIQTDESRVRPWEIWHLQSDNTKLYSVINARPETPLALGLAETIKYCKEHAFDF